MWWERLQRRATWRGGQDGHSEDGSRIKLRPKTVNTENAFDSNRTIGGDGMGRGGTSNVLQSCRESTKVIPTHEDIKPEDRELLGHLHLVASQLAEQLGVADGYRLVINCKERAGQSVPHLHMHLLGGRDFRWPPG